MIFFPPPPPPPSPSHLQLRLTNFPEKKEETPTELFEAVKQLLASLPRVVEPVAASRIGEHVNREYAARAVHITFASTTDRESVLRYKAALSKKPDTRRFSINEVLTREEQAHKQALWGMFVHAKNQQRHAVFRGCNLYIDGNLVGLHAQQFSTIAGHDDVPTSGPVSGLTSFPLPSYPSLYNNPIAEPPAPTPPHMQPLAPTHLPFQSVSRPAWTQPIHPQPGPQPQPQPMPYHAADTPQLPQPQPVPSQQYLHHNPQISPAMAPPMNQAQSAQQYLPITPSQPLFRPQMPQMQAQPQPHPQIQFHAQPHPQLQFQPQPQSQRSYPRHSHAPPHPPPHQYSAARLP
ncbi:hypothetical protein WJX74_007964 [Apatococcus lobatus]|uniref:Uncharacterized protein n=1 Tax=Apatococcus lobatus TaxID=904363 RepID=A0AAW1RTV7_9CHLO